MQPVDSSLLAAAGYDEHMAVLKLAFRNGANYCYIGVPAQTYQELLRAESKGKYFNAHIRNRFGCTKITAADTHSPNN